MWLAKVLGLLVLCEGQSHLLYRQQGFVVSTTGLAHLVLDVDLDKSTKVMDRLRKCLDVYQAGLQEVDKTNERRYWLRMKSSEHLMKSRLHRLDTEYKQISDTFIHHQLDRNQRQVTRPKRQLIIGAIALAIFGAVLSNSDLLSLNGRVKSGQQLDFIQLQHKFEENEHDIKVLNQTLAMLGLAVYAQEGRLKDIGKMLDFDSYDNIIEQHATTIEDKISKLISGLWDLLQGHLSPHFINIKHMETVLFHLQAKMELRGMSLAITSPIQIFQLPVSYLMENNVIRIFVHIPAYAINSEIPLYLYRPLPHVAPEENVVIYIDIEDRYLAIDHAATHFATFTTEQLGTCLQIEPYYHCKNLIYRRQIETSCVASLFSTKAKTMPASCKRFIAPLTDDIIQLDTSYAVISREDGTLRSRCPGGKIENEIQLVKGLSFHDLQPGCSITTNTHMFNVPDNLTTTYEVQVFNLTLTLVDFTTPLLDQGVSGNDIKGILKHLAEVTTTPVEWHKVVIPPSTSIWEHLLMVLRAFVTTVVVVLVVYLGYKWGRYFLTKLKTNSTPAEHIQLAPPL